MFLIVLYHCNLHLNYNVDDSIWHGSFTSSSIVLTVFGSWGQLGVNCFVLISAYFLTDNKGIKTKNLLRIILQTAFYSALAASVLVGTDIVDFSIKFFVRDIAKSLLGGYWFVLAYCLMYVTAPFLNTGIRVMSDKQLRNISLFLLTVSVLFVGLLRSFSAVGTYTWFIALYLLMAYLKRKPENFFRKHAVFGTIISFSLSLIVLLVLMKLGGGWAARANGLFHIASPFILTQSLFLFYNFETRKPSNVALINRIADSSFGIYLFHENYALYANERNTGLIWDSIFGIGDYLKANSVFFVLHYILACLIVFIIGMLIDMIRKYLLENPIFRIRLVITCCDKLDEILN